MPLPDCYQQVKAHDPDLYRKLVELGAIPYCRLYGLIRDPDSYDLVQSTGAAVENRAMEIVADLLLKFYEPDPYTEETV